MLKKKTVIRTKVSKKNFRIIGACYDELLVNELNYCELSLFQDNWFQFGHRYIFNWVLVGQLKSKYRKLKKED